MADAVEAADASGTAESEESGQDATASPIRPAMAKGSLSRFAMIFLGMLAIFALIEPSLSQTFGDLAGLILFPLIGFGGAFPVITILLAGMLTTTISSVLRHHYTDWVKMMRTNKVMAAWRKENMEALRKGNQSKIQKMKAIQQDLMKDSMDVQFAPMKSMAWTFFFFIVLFVWLRVFVDQILSFVGNQYIAVPWAPRVWLESAYLFPSWILLYSLLAIPFSQIVTRILKYVRFRRKLESMGLPLKAEADQTT